MLCAWHHLAPLSGSHGSPIPRPPWYSEGIRDDINTGDIMYKCSMTRSCDPMALPLFGHTHQVAFESRSTFGGRGASLLPSPSYSCSQGTVFGVRYPSRWALASFGYQPNMTTTSRSMQREKRYVEDMIRRIVWLENYIRSACKVCRPCQAGFSARAN